MTNSYTINIDRIGPVLFEKSRRAKRVIISVRTSKGTRVAVPTRTSFKKALEFVCLKKEWIQRHLAKIEQNENQRKASIDPFLAIDKADARKRLTDRLYHLAKEHGFTYNDVSIREQRTRWGSCSSKNNISLNVKLVLLPKELIDYVILHELVHTRIHNHSRKFWAELDKYVGNARVKAKRLKVRWSPKFGQVVKSGFCSYNEYGIGGERETEPKETHAIVQSQGSPGSIKG